MELIIKDFVNHLFDIVKLNLISHIRELLELKQLKTFYNYMTSIKQLVIKIQKKF